MEQNNDAIKEKQSMGKRGRKPKAEQTQVDKVADVGVLERRLAELEAENRRLRGLVPVETETRKLSVTLPVTVWNSVDSYLVKNNVKQASFFAELAKSYFEKEQSER